MNASLRRPRVMLTLPENGQNGGPYVSHQRILNSALSDRYDLLPLWTPPPKALLYGEGLARFVDTVRQAQPDLVQFSGMQLGGFTVLRALRRAGVTRTVCAIRGSSRDALDFPAYKRWVVKRLEAWTLRHCTACYGVSRFVSQWDWVQAIRPDTGYIYNLPAADGGLAAADRPAAADDRRAASDRRAALGIAPDDTVVVSAGRITTDKGYAVLADALAAGAPWPGVTFLIVGEGAYRATLAARAAQAGLEVVDLVDGTAPPPVTEAGPAGRMVLTGYRADVPALLAASDVFVLCTLHETLCNAVIEASQQGLPVVATATGGIPEIVVSEQSGLLCPPGDSAAVCRALRRLIDDPTLRRTWGARGQELVAQNFDPDITLQRLDALYAQVLAR